MYRADGQGYIILRDEVADEKIASAIEVAQTQVGGIKAENLVLDIIKSSNLKEPMLWCGLVSGQTKYRRNYHRKAELLLKAIAPFLKEGHVKYVEGDKTSNDTWVFDFNSNTGEWDIAMRIQQGKDYCESYNGDADTERLTDEDYEMIAICVEDQLSKDSGSVEHLVIEKIAGGLTRLHR